MMNVYEVHHTFDTLKRIVDYFESNIPWQSMTGLIPGSVVRRVLTPREREEPFMGFGEAMEDDFFKNHPSLSHFSCPVCHLHADLVLVMSYHDDGRPCEIRCLCQRNYYHHSSIHYTVLSHYPLTDPIYIDDL